ncbi:META domain-containing protein [Pseudomonas saudimassiliensis]|uniref:META domain-containing protein n=1 Tax=Pseudomonas saudimassiliensis TaxID=1461581 RepID=A0A078M992_9PSED|nr:META domain-containing protein [Pseudomonas saudimassiliensis]CEA01226.1 META domain-containing protein [Pseudomonas saudimassiliensis]CEF25443.1 META domain-containing protein [Pseudomonas saudimassiliensis]
MSTLRMLLPAALACTLLVAGCASTGPSVNPEALTGHTWTLVEATDADGRLDTALTGGERPPIELSFHSDRLGVRNACNGMGGDYQLKGDTLEIGNLMQTMMACEPALMAREDAIKQRLQQPLQLQFDEAGNRLTLRNGAGIMTFQPAAAQPAP